MSGTYVIDPTLGKWLKDFTYEANPEQEIQIWEEIAIVFDRYNKTHRLIQAYGGRCSITGCSVEPVLEAAHIIPYLGAKTDHPSNGLLLRADIHNLFDSHYLTIHPETKKVETAPSLKGTCYADLAGRPLRIPFSKTDRPNLKALLKHYQTFSARWFSWTMYSPHLLCDCSSFLF